LRLRGFGTNVSDEHATIIFKVEKWGSKLIEIIRVWMWFGCAGCLYGFWPLRIMGRGQGVEPGVGK